MKIVFIDIDGTLRTDKKEVTKRTKNIIEKITSQGDLVVISTGRPLVFTKRVSIESRASRYIISCSGALVYDYEQNKTIFTNSINKDDCKYIYKNVINEADRIVIDTKEKRYVTVKKHDYEYLIEEELSTFVDNHDIIHFVIDTSTSEVTKKLMDIVLKRKNLQIINKSKYIDSPNLPEGETLYFDIADINTSKGSAITKLCEHLNIPLEERIAIGNDHNDVSMFEVVNYSVAMENANDEIKSKANEITKSNNDDGVAIYLEKLLGDSLI